MSDLADQHASQGSSSTRQSDLSNQVTACRRCRKQKLRCSREKPTCKRCQDISALCTYPPPPDRKLLAAQRTQNAKARAALRESGNVNPQNEPHFSPSGPGRGFDSHSNADSGFYDAKPNPGVVWNSLEDASYARHGDSVTSSSPVSSSQPRIVAFPPLDIALSLAKIYFSHMYNAHLLFHQQTLIAELECRGLPDYVFLSIFALGSIFLQDPSKFGPDSGLDKGQLAPNIMEYAKYGHEWATSASQQVLMNADQPRHETIPTCANLALYWFSRDQTDRTNVHAHVAYRTCRILGYHIQAAPGTDIDLVYGEVKRRCFWACWLTSCISQENAAFKARSWNEAVGLSLPCDEESFRAGLPILKEVFDENGSVVPITPPQSLGPARPSIMSEVAKLFGLWWEIQRFVRNYVDEGPHDSSKRFSTLQDLDHRLENVHDNMPEEFQYKGGPTTFSLTSSENNQLFYLRCVYHLCACTLHSSIVPLFSNIAADAQISKKLSRVSAEEAVKHSQITIDMAGAFLKTTPDLSMVSSLGGYAMFFASAIHFKTLGAQRKLESHAIGRLYPAVLILRRLKDIWYPCHGLSFLTPLLWMGLSSLFQSAGFDINALLNSPPQSLPDTTTDIDQIIAYGAVGGTLDVYTYIPPEEDKAESDRQSSVEPSSSKDTRSHGIPSPVQIPRSISSKAKRKGKHQPRIPSHHSQSPPPNVYQSVQSHAMYHVPPIANLQIVDNGEILNVDQSMVTSNPSEYIATNPLHGVRPSLEPHFHQQQQQQQIHGMVQPVQGSMVPGPGGMDVDSVNLWWDQSFDSTQTFQYGFIPGSFPPAPGNEYYRQSGPGQS